MSQFIGYHIDRYDCDKAVPVATGTTKEEAMQKLARRILSAGVTDGAMQVQERPDVSAEDFAALTKLTDEFAASKGLVS